MLQTRTVSRTISLAEHIMRLVGLFLFVCLTAHSTLYISSQAQSTVSLFLAMGRFRLAVILPTVRP